jgi:hypothetical protein
VAAVACLDGHGRRRDGPQDGDRERRDEQGGSDHDGQSAHEQE